MPVKSICGVILIARDPETLAAFYSEGLGLTFAREKHGGLAPHFGLDLGALHFAIHPPSNFHGRGPSRATPIAFEVDALEPHLQRLRELGAEVLDEPRDQGFGRTVMLADPAGNLLELVELTHRFED